MSVEQMAVAVIVGLVGVVWALFTGRMNGVEAKLEAMATRHATSKDTLAAEDRRQSEQIAKHDAQIEALREQLVDIKGYWQSGAALERPFAPRGLPREHVPPTPRDDPLGRTGEGMT